MNDIGRQIWKQFRYNVKRQKPIQRTNSSREAEMPTKLGKVMKNHMKDLKCEVYEQNLSKERGETAWTKERRPFPIYDKRFIQYVD